MESIMGSNHRVLDSIKLGSFGAIFLSRGLCGTFIFWHHELHRQHTLS